MTALVDLDVVDPTHHLRRMGALHDVRISDIRIDPGAEQISISTPDVLANFEGLNHYPDKMLCSLVFKRVRYLKLGLSLSDGLRIDRCLVKRKVSHLWFRVHLNEGMSNRTTMDCPIEIECELLTMRLNQPNADKYKSFLFTLK